MSSPYVTLSVHQEGDLSIAAERRGVKGGGALRFRVSKGDGAVILLTPEELADLLWLADQTADEWDIP